MASTTISCSNTDSRERPLMLKDFLLEDSNSCSSNGFKSILRKACRDSGIGNLIQIDLNSGQAKPNHAQRLQRSRSKAASATVSAIQAMINAVKNIHFTSVKSPSILPRSLSRKLSKKNSQPDVGKKESEIKSSLTVKDIIRWKSFRDFVEEKEKPRPSDFASSPHHFTTTTTTGSTCTPCSSSGSSWCDSDFTLEYLPSEEHGENEVDVGKKLSQCVGKDRMQTTTEVAADAAVGTKGRKYACDEEKKQHSPLSVLDFEYEEDDEDSFSTFNRSLATMERTKQKLMQKIQLFESLAKLESVNLEKWMSLEEEEETNDAEEKAWLLLNRVKETSSVHSYKNISADKLLLDLLREELAANWNQTRNEELDSDMVRLAEAWINGEQNETAKWGVGGKRETCVRDMDMEGTWSKLGREQEELAWEVEIAVMNILVDELLVDFL